AAVKGGGRLAGRWKGAAEMGGLDPKPTAVVGKKRLEQPQHGAPAFHRFADVMHRLGAAVLTVVEHREGGGELLLRNVRQRRASGDFPARGCVLVPAGCSWRDLV